MNPNSLHESRTPIDRRTRKQLWMLTAVTSGVILAIAICFFALR
jgi:hypothetical protein